VRNRVAWSIIIFYLIGCNSVKDEQIFETRVLGNLIVSSKFRDLNGSMDLEVFSYPREKLTVLKYLTASCSLCLLELADWKKFVSDNGLNEKLEIVFIVGGESKLDIDFIFHKSNYNPTYFYDVHYDFLDTNQISADRSYQTLLINKLGEVIYIGNPFDGDKQSKAFKESILKL
jgi:hypothetical protein